MNYFILDFSGTNETAPSQEELDGLREAGVELSHEYGMSYSSNPKAALDLFMNARTGMTLEDLEKELKRFTNPPRRVRLDSPSRKTIRGASVESEFAR